MKIRRYVLAILAMTAFAANSLLCRMALKSFHIDAASFTAVRIISGAVVLWMLVRLSKRNIPASGNWLSAFTLFAYAAAFSFAYIGLSAGTGALILFGSVQATMIVYGLWSGERLAGQQKFGLMLALGGLVAFTAPGISAPPLVATALMLLAGIAWGVYSVRGKGAAAPLHMTAGNFLRAVPLGLLLLLMFLPNAQADGLGVTLAIFSGAIASGAGYAIWYSVVREIRMTTAAIMQLSVPIIASLGGMLFLKEAITLHLILSSAAILSGIAMAVRK